MSTPPDSSSLDPPAEKDVSMGPSPAPPTDAASTSSSAVQQKSSGKDSTADIVEKYKKLKRRYFELEEKHKETTDELQRSSERNVRIRQERNMLLERILELEAQPQIQANGTSSSSDLVAQPSSSAFPRSLLNARARTSFVANLRQAEAEGDAGEDETDPSLSSSRHVGGGKRDEEKRQNELGAEEAHDSYREVKRPRVSNGKEKEVEERASRSPSPQRGASPNTGSKEGASLASRGGPSVNSQADAKLPVVNGVNGNMDVDATTDKEGGVRAVGVANTSNGRRAPKRRASNSNDTEADGSSTRGGKTRRSTRKSAAAAAAAIASEALDNTSPEPGPSTPPRSTGTVTAGPSEEKTPPTSQFQDSQDVTSSVPSEAQTKREPPSASPISSTPEPNRTGSEPVIDPSLTAAASASTPSEGIAPPSTASSTASSASPAPTSTSTPTSSTFNPYSIYLPNANSLSPNTPTYTHPYANPYLYMIAPTMAGLHPGIPPMPGMMPPMYPPGPAGPSTLPPPAPQRASAEPPRQTKPKRLKAHTVTTKNFSIPMVPRDKKGHPMLPLNVGIMTVISLGEVCMREHFHTERYIFPVGYEVTRRYLSTKDPTVEVVYHCTILDGGDGPKFQIVPSDASDKPIIAGTATGAWSNIVRQANAIRNRQHSNSVSGPDFFGLGQNTIKHLIQQLPNADKLRDYVWQNFVEGGPLGGRHAAVIPALPEEYDASMPIGAFYPTKRERESSVVPESPRASSHYPPHIMAQQRTTPQPRSASQTHNMPQAGSLQPPPLQQLTPMTQATPVARQIPIPPGGGTQMVLPSALNIQQYRPPNDADAAVVTSGESVPATFASIMNAYPTTAGPNDSPTMSASQLESEP